MALILKLNRLQCTMIVLNLQKLPNSYRQIHNKSITLHVDEIWDSFTSKILRKTLTKFNNNNKTSCKFVKTIDKATDDTITTDIENLTTNQITTEFQDAFDHGDNNKVMNLIEQCIKYKQFPSLAILLHGISICAQNGNKQLIIKIRESCETIEPDFCETNSHFQHYLAEAVWMNGDITKSIELFECVYRKKPYLRRRIRLIIKYLISNLITNHSEAALLNLIKFSERLLYDFKDNYLLCCIWQACFLSNWYTDQCLALELLERHNGLFKNIANRVPFVVSNALKQHKIEIVYRLLEFLLKYEVKSVYSDVLISLLDYHFYWGDKRSCLEILQWAENHNVALPTNLHAKMIDLLIGKNEKSIINNNNDNNKKIQRHKYDLKF